MTFLNRLYLQLFICFFTITIPSIAPANDTAQRAITFSNQELNWMQHHPEIIVGGGPDWAPFDFVDSNNQYSGIANDYLTLIAKYTGLKFKISIDNWNNHLDNIKNKKIDLIGAAYFTKERNSFVNYSEPYFEVLDYFFIRDDLKVNTLKDLNNKRVAVPQNYAQHSILKKHFPLIKIITVDNFGNAIDAVLENKADMLFDAYATISHTLNKEGIKTIVPFKSNRHLGTNQIHIITRKNAPELSSIVQKALNKITILEKQKIHIKWLGQSQNSDVKISLLNKEERQWIKDHPQVFVGGLTDVLPFNFTNNKNQYQGIVNDYLQLISKKTELNFIVKTDKWNNLLAKLKQKEIDIVGGAYYTDERSQYALFSDSFFEAVDYFFIHQNIHAETIDDLNGMRVAMPKGFVHGTLLKTHFPKIHLVEVDSIGASIDAVLENKAELLFNSFATLKYTLKKNGIDSITPFKSTRKQIGTNHYRMMIRNDEPLLESIINKGLSAINETEKQLIYDKWLGKNPKKDTLLNLSQTEKKWLNRHKNIRFVGNPNGLPLEAFNKQGQHTGITAEHLKIIERKLGIQLQKIPTKTWQESVEKIKAGEADILSEATSSELQSFLSFTQPYISSPVVIVMKNNNHYIENISQIKGKNLALIRDYGYADEIIEKYPDITFSLVNNIQDGLTAVSVGKIDALLATLAQSSYHIAELGINNILIVGKTEFTSEQAFSIRSELAPLIPLFNRAIKSINLREKQEIFDNWGKSRFAVKTNYQLIFQIASVLVIIIAVFIYWNRKLAKEVNLRVQIEQQTQSIIDAIPIQIIITSPEGKILSANPQALNDYNIDKDEITQFNMIEFYSNPEDRIAIIEELSTNGNLDQKLVKFKRLNDEERSMMISIMPVTFNNTMAFLSIAVDLTDRLEMEEALHVAKESAENANKAKSIFLANMSHEIRTPMNAIIGFTELLNDQIQDSKLKKYTQIIQKAGNNLLTLINDILDLSKIESGRYKILKTASNPHELFSDIGNIFMMKMQENNIDFSINIDPAIPKSLFLDTTRIRQVVFNLIGNAVKFTKNGTIKVIITPENKDEILSTLDLKISIQDSGIGIAQDQIDIIFKEFEQAKDQDSNQYGGTGLGLPISKRLVEMMGGKINVQSELNKGSTFNILLSHVDVASVSQEEVHSNPKGDIKYDFNAAQILVVDDIADNRDLILENLSVFPSLTVKEAKNGKEAIQLSKENNFDLILMDIRMPIMDGYQATHQIRQFSKTPIVALTASVIMGEFRPLQKDDFDGYLRKPVLKKDLFAELSKHISYDDVKQEDNDRYNITVNTKELDFLSGGIKNLKLLQEQCHNVKQSNDIPSINQFANNVLSLTDQYPIKAIKDYATNLLTDIDSFDISGIKSNLDSFSVLISKLEIIANKHH